MYYLWPLCLGDFVLFLVGVDQIAEVGQFFWRELAGFDQVCNEAMGGAVEDSVHELAEHGFGGGGLRDGGCPLVSARGRFAFHQAFVETNEWGTEAAAATATSLALYLDAGPSKPREIPIFRADHPFLFAIRDRKSGAILFIGRMADPTRRT